MEPLSVISLFFNLASFSADNEKSKFKDNQYYYSVADAKHQIFNGKVENLDLKNLENFSNYTLSIKK